MMSGYPYHVINLKSACQLLHQILSSEDELEPLCKVINDSQDVPVPFDLHECAHQISPNLSPDTVGNVHYLEFGQHFLEIDRCGHLALVTGGSEVVGNFRTDSRPAVPLSDFLPCFVLS